MFTASGDSIQKNSRKRDPHVDAQDKESFFYPYYNTLPKTLSNMPIFWSSEELDYLEGSHLLQQIQDRKDAIRRDYNEICAVDPSFGDKVTLEKFSWARMIVCR